jgi:hypothetical protein
LPAVRLVGTDLSWVVGAAVWIDAAAILTVKLCPSGQEWCKPRLTGTAAFSQGHDLQIANPTPGWARVLSSGGQNSQYDTLPSIEQQDEKCPTGSHDDTC